ncbi:MAG TPA: ParB/RepB/Spo0J family partition protein [Armatimonadota bacterium]
MDDTITTGPSRQSYVLIPLDQIETNPYQPRRQFNQVALQELVASVTEHGVLQPIIVRRHGSGYQLVSGERRFQASKRVGLAAIPAVVRDFDDRTVLEVAIVENVQREDIGPLEAAEAYRRLIDEFHLTQEQVALRVGKSRSAISNTLRLLKLPPAIRAALSCGDITEGHARSLLSIQDPDWQLRVFNRIVQNDLSVRDAEHLAYGTDPEDAERPKRRERQDADASRETPGRRTKERDGEEDGAAPRDPHLAALEDRLRLLLGTRVRIRGSASAGTIGVDYYSAEDLERILNLLGLM